MGDFSRYYTVQQFADAFRISDDQVLNLIGRGGLRAVNLAVDLRKRPLWRIPAEELERFVRSRQSLPTPKKGRKKSCAATGGPVFFP